METLGSVVPVSFRFVSCVMGCRSCPLLSIYKEVKNIMARKKTLGGKAPQVGNRVSHSHRKTRHAWMPNIQKRALFSAALGRSICMTLPTSMLRSVDRAGGLDAFLLQAPSDQLEKPIRRLQALITQSHDQASRAP